MTVILLTTIIHASPECCFDLSRSVAVHLGSMVATDERVVGGRAEGLFETGDEVTWEAVHFGIRQRMTVRITTMERPHYFVDEMMRGAFKSMHHRHEFRAADGGTEMKDIFSYETPFGIAGKIFDMLILKNYMTRFLQRRNIYIKAAAEKA